MEEDTRQERIHGSTIELKDPSALDILEDVQEILTQMIQPGMYAKINEEILHEQTRTALNLVLKAITVLRKAERRNQRA